MSLHDLQAAEIAGWRDTWVAAPADLAARAGIFHLHQGGLLSTTVTAAPGRLTTHVLGLTDDLPGAAGALAAAEAFCARHAVAPLVAVPDGAAAEAGLAARGYVRDYVWTKFARDTSPAAPHGSALDVRPVAPADAARMGRIVVASFGLPAELGAWFAALVGRPDWHVLGAYDGAELVATGSLFVHGDVGWVTWGATDAAHRGRRAQKALLAGRIDVARALGLRELVTETGEPEQGGRDASYRNILGAGFRIVYRRPFWRGRVAAAAPAEAGRVSPAGAASTGGS